MEQWNLLAFVVSTYVWMGIGITSYLLSAGGSVFRLTVGAGFLLGFPLTWPFQLMFCSGYRLGIRCFRLPLWGFVLFALQFGLSSFLHEYCGEILSVVVAVVLAAPCSMLVAGLFNVFNYELME